MKKSEIRKLIIACLITLSILFSLLAVCFFGKQNILGFGKSCRTRRERSKRVCFRQQCEKGRRRQKLYGSEKRNDYRNGRKRKRAFCRHENKRQHIRRAGSNAHRPQFRRAEHRSYLIAAFCRGQGQIFRKPLRFIQRRRRSCGCAYSRRKRNGGRLYPIWRNRTNSFKNPLRLLSPRYKYLHEQRRVFRVGIQGRTTFFRVFRFQRIFGDAQHDENSRPFTTSLRLSQAEQIV